MFKPGKGYSNILLCGFQYACGGGLSCVHRRVKETASSGQKCLLAVLP